MFNLPHPGFHSCIFIYYSYFQRLFKTEALNQSLYKQVGYEFIGEVRGHNSSPSHVELDKSHASVSLFVSGDKISTLFLK